MMQQQSSIDARIIYQAKHELRRKFKTLRNAYPLSRRRIRSEKICNHIANHPLWHSANTIGMYIPLRSEVIVTALIEKGISSGKVIVVPKVKESDSSMGFAQIKSEQSLVPGPWGTQEPDSQCKVIREDEIDLVLVPGLAVDLFGYRLGYGRGCYDRTLPNLKSATSLCVVHDFQMVTELPRDEYDFPMHFIVSEKGVQKTQSS